MAKRDSTASEKTPARLQSQSAWAKSPSPNNNSSAPLQVLQSFAPSSPQLSAAAGSPASLPRSSSYSTSVMAVELDSETSTPRPSFVSADPPTLPDLTRYISKANDQYVSRGTFGDVYRYWYDDGSRKEVAVKAFRFRFSVDGDTNDRSAKMLIRELGIWKRLNHINVVPFLGVAYGFGMHGAMSLVSLWMANESLHHFLAKHDNNLHLGHRLLLLLDIANGLQYLHTFSIVHGDLNPNNVLLDADYTARLADFGYASLVGDIPEALTYLQTSTTRPGALRWTAPEQVDPEETSNRTTKSDVYSFGCVALQGCCSVTSATFVLIFSQVLSGKQPWSEVREDLAIIFRLAKGRKPGRPESRAVNDSHWNLIQRCWSPIAERPAADLIIFTIQRFLSYCPQCPHIRDSIVSSSSHTDSLLGESSPLSQVITEEDREWVARGDVIAPTTISAVHETVRIWDANFLWQVTKLSVPVAPLEMSANRWVAASTLRKPVTTDTVSPALVGRRVRALLDNFTMEKFDSISHQIISWVNKSKNEKDGRTLIHVIRLVFEKAIDEAAWSEMYARLCRKLMETISPEVQDDGIRDTEGKPIAGGQLFRKYLLNRCQEDFERGWVAKETTAAAAAAKASDDQAIKAANEKTGDESELYSDEYYAAQKAKRQGLGLIKFIGELFKLQMLTERIMHECVKKLLGNFENPEEEKIEGLCQLLKTVGQQLDVPQARAHMDVYFTRMKELCKSPNVSPRTQSMLQDVIELRDRKWVARGAVIAPTTISAVYEAAAKEKAAVVAQQHQFSKPRGGSRRGGDRNVESGPDGWTTTGDFVARPQPKVGYLSQFGKISKAAPMVMGPSSVFTKKDTKRDSLSRTSLSSNMFSMLSQNPELAVDTTAKSSRPPSRKPSVDLGQGGVPEPPRRKKLQLLPRSKPMLVEETTPPASEDEPEAPVQMSEADAKKKIDEDVKEFFAVRSMEEADVYFTNLPEEYRFHLVDKLVASALESKEADAVLVSEFFHQAASKGQCSFEVFEAGFMPMAELLDDISIDAPNAFKFMAMMLKGAGFDKDEERLARLAGKSMDSDKLLQLVSS